jgi:hypothetical protein
MFAGPVRFVALNLTGPFLVQKRPSFTKTRPWPPAGASSRLRMLTAFSGAS